MNEIVINICNFGRVSDQEVLRVVREAINYSIKWDEDRTLNINHYWHDPNKRVELKITFK